MSGRDQPTDVEATFEIIPFPHQFGFRAIVATVEVDNNAGPLRDENSVKYVVWNTGPGTVDVFSTETEMSISTFSAGESGMVDTVGPVSARIVSA